MRITAKVIEDSVPFGLNNRRLTTMELEYPRFIHAEFMTHRVFSRNASSSRAIPVEKLVGMALEDPAFFVEIGKNQKGMQAKELVNPMVAGLFRDDWEALAEIVAGYARRWSALGIHKQVVNRVMEPWHHIKVVVTATDWKNFFELRDHPDAQPEIRALAIRMREAMNSSSPVVRGHHLPYVTEDERGRKPFLDLSTLYKLSTARCARVSYMNHDNTTPDIDKDCELHDQLVGSKPIHASPAEHSAIAWSYAPDILRSNFSQPWVQYRKYVECGLNPDFVYGAKP